MQQKIRIAPSILSSDFSRLGEEIRELDQAGADYFHIDVMDGHFVPNITLGFPVITSIRSYTQKTFDVHLMIEPVDPFIADFAKAGADILTVHPESGPHLHRTVQTIKANGMRAGVALNPTTPLAHLDAIMDDIDLILVMTINPGFGGQKLIPSTIERVRQVRRMIDATGRAIDLEVDGGVDAVTCKQVIEAGADLLVAGSAVFKDKNYAANIAALRG